jgi:hypothetical protein
MSDSTISIRSLRAPGIGERLDDWFEMGRRLGFPGGIVRMMAGWKNSAEGPLVMASFAELTFCFLGRYLLR